MVQLHTNLSAKAQIALLEKMLLIRRAEERLVVGCAEGHFPGSGHLYIGQEAVAVAACSVLTDADYITSTHRGHGHFLAKGGDLKAMFAEIWAKDTGICRGMGGSMHVADISKGILGANGIVGAGFGIATGAAWGAKLEGKGRVAVCFFGDGAANQGSFAESMNLSAIWQLPTVFVCEDNGLSEFTVSDTITAGKLLDRARPFMPSIRVDGNDVLAVAGAVAEAVDRARQGNGPSYVECSTYRIRGHLEAEKHMLGGGTYRSEEEVTAWRAEDRDPISRFSRHLLETGVCDQAALDAVQASIAEKVQQAAAFADASPPADPTLAAKIMFVDQAA